MLMFNELKIALFYVLKSESLFKRRHGLSASVIDDAGLQLLCLCCLFFKKCDPGVLKSGSLVSMGVAMSSLMSLGEHCDM